ncbi:MAG: hypothetical protein LBJ12_09470 [Oscillospiraceae bacterium]|jgi:hypothetical protein|nr:hypothetical protein [Oscillospiraceae bacterium]
MIDKVLLEGISSRNILYVSFDNPVIKMVGADDVLSAYETPYSMIDFEKAAAQFLDKKKTALYPQWKKERLITPSGKRQKRPQESFSL